MPKLTKVCPECSVSVNVKKSVCDCGHTFVLKRKVSIDATRKSKRIAMRCKRASESPSKSMSRRELNRASMSKNRALESQNESMTRREQILFTLTEHSG